MVKCQFEQVTLVGDRPSTTHGDGDVPGNDCDIHLVVVSHPVDEQTIPLLYQFHL